MLLSSLEVIDNRQWPLINNHSLQLLPSGYLAVFRSYLHIIIISSLADSNSPTATFLALCWSSHCHPYLLYLLYLRLQQSDLLQMINVEDLIVVFIIHIIIVSINLVDIHVLQQIGYLYNALIYAERSHHPSLSILSCHQSIAVWRISSCPRWVYSIPTCQSYGCAVWAPAS